MLDIKVNFFSQLLFCKNFDKTKSTASALHRQQCCSIKTLRGWHHKNQHLHHH